MCTFLVLLFMITSVRHDSSHPSLFSILLFMITSVRHDSSHPSLGSVCVPQLGVLPVKQNQQRGQAADRHGGPPTPLPMSSSVQTDLRRRVPEEAREAGQPAVNSGVVGGSAALSEAHHPGLHPGLIRHLADEGPSWIALKTRRRHAHDSFSFTPPGGVEGLQKEGLCF